MSAFQRENEVTVGTIPNGDWQELRVNVYNFRGHPYVSLAVHRVSSDGGSFLRGFAIRPSLWHDAEPIIRQALVVAGEREDAAILAASMSAGDRRQR